MVALASSGFANPFKAECEGDGNEWHLMQPTKAGVVLSATPQEGCMWGMGQYPYMFANQKEYEYVRSYPHAVVSLTHTPEHITAGVPTTLTFFVKNPDGTPATLFIDMEKILHIVVVSKDQTVFAHIHADDFAPLTQKEIDTSTFSRTFTFPKAGEYLISTDYANGTALESQQFRVNVDGGPAQNQEVATYSSPGRFGGYDVSLRYEIPGAGQVSNLYYTITKDGKPVNNLVPYLAGAMHVSVVKNDFTAFLHVHGEIHLPGVPLPPIIVKDGQVIHSMAAMIVPDHFGSPIDAHLIFPSSGLYTVWGEFKVGDTVIPTTFTVQVQ
jgi:hypothetical protein